MIQCLSWLWDWLSIVFMIIVCLLLSWMSSRLILNVLVLRTEHSYWARAFLGFLFCFQLLFLCLVWWITWLRVCLSAVWFQWKHKYAKWRRRRGVWTILECLWLEKTILCHPNISRMGNLSSLIFLPIAPGLSLNCHVASVLPFHGWSSRFKMHLLVVLSGHMLVKNAQTQLCGLIRARLIRLMFHVVSYMWIYHREG